MPVMSGFCSVVAPVSYTHLDVYKRQTLDGVIYEIAMGLSTPIIQYNATAIEAAGMPLPEMEMTWEELKDYLIDLKNTGKLPDGMYAIYDECGVNGAFHWFYSYMRQKGEDWWTPDGKLGFTQATVCLLYTSRLKPSMALVV